jgi:hypothetical protein
MFLLKSVEEAEDDRLSETAARAPATSDVAREQTGVEAGELVDDSDTTSIDNGADGLETGTIDTDDTVGGGG